MPTGVYYRRYIRPRSSRRSGGGIVVIVVAVAQLHTLFFSGGIARDADVSQPGGTVCFFLPSLNNLSLFLLPIETHILLGIYFFTMTTDRQ